MARWWWALAGPWLLWPARPWAGLARSLLVLGWPWLVLLVLDWPWLVLAGVWPSAEDLSRCARVKHARHRGQRLR